MRFAISLLMLALAAPVLAQEQPRVEIDTNLICDTQQQVERFVALFKPDEGSAEAAIARVNAENDARDACVIATTAYQRSDKVGTATSADAAFDVVRIVVVGVHTLNGFEESLPTEFFTLLPRDEAPSTVGQR